MGLGSGLTEGSFLFPSPQGSGISSVLPIVFKTTYPASGVSEPVFGVPTMLTFYPGKAHFVLQVYLNMQVKVLAGTWQ